MIKLIFIILMCAAPFSYAQTTVKLLQEVNIKTTKKQIERKLDKTVINVENSNLAVGNNALDIISTVPGISVANDGTIQLNGKPGLMVMLDGKLTYLSGAQLTDLLRQTSSSQIKSIELMAQPPAKYDAAGSAGIININLKRNKELGTNGTVTTEAALGRYLKANTGIALNKRTDHFSFYGNYTYADNKRYGKLNLDRLLTIPGRYNNIEQQSGSLTNNYNHNYRAGIDYFINGQHSLGIAVNGYANRQVEAIEVSSLIKNDNLASDGLTKAANSGKNNYRNIAYNATYRYLIDTVGQHFSIDLDLLNYNNLEREDFDNRFFDSDNIFTGVNARQRSISPTKLNVRALKLDYSYPLLKTINIDFGLKSSQVKTDNSLNFQDFFNEEWILNSDRSNRFVYTETIHAAYVSINRTWSATSLRAGLRAEKTSTKGRSIHTQALIDRNYLNFFPSLFLSHQLNKDHVVGLNLSRRIDRPNYGSLNPFSYVLDLYTYRKGNPYLQPQYTNSATLSYQMLQQYNLSLSYSDTKDVIVEVVLPDTSNSLFRRPENLSRQRTFNLNFGLPIKLTNFWTVENDINVFRSRFTSTSILGAAYQQSKTAVNFRSAQQIKLNDFARIDFAANYQSAQLYGTSYLEGYGYFDFGVSKQFLQNRLNLKLAIKDIFNSRSQTMRGNLPGLNYTLYEKVETRLFAIGINYSFGGKAVKAAPNHSEAIQEEKNRIGAN